MPMQSPAPVAAAAALEDDVDRIVALFRQAWRQLRAGDPRDWAGGLSMPQIRVLFFLSKAGPSSVGDVAAGVEVAQPSATETLDRLVRAGLVKRKVDPADRRVVRNALTAAGREMVDRPWEMRRAVLAGALRDTAPEDRAAIVRGLRLLSRALNEEERETRSMGEGMEKERATT
jgi:DNA-binding MarR family transcriptional regulator